MAGEPSLGHTGEVQVTAGVTGQAPGDDGLVARAGKNLIAIVNGAGNGRDPV